MRAGMDVARLNFSHGTHTDHQHRINLIRKLNKKHRRRIRIMQDLEGYRIRIGSFKKRKTVELKKKQVLLLTKRKNVEGDGTVIPFDYVGLLQDIKVGSYIYIDDGTIVLQVKGRAADSLKTEVIIPGILRERKGVNIPDSTYRFTGVTEKDRVDIQFGIKNRVDYIAQSFVRDREDIIQIRDLVQDSLPACKIIAKIENRQGIENIDRILEVADGIMIARGDMGVSRPIYEIPMIQKMIIRKCNERKKPAITATQMLGSMTEHVRPTRAEVTDVANAILDGSDFVMLSEETAVGKYPVEAVRMMKQIIKFTERFVE
ncbi:MAG: pyruvate kinase [Candidatus Omnitrophica bacterium]|nr:pyruvate kinase [Candidatus Omnitrophota bacterium]